MKKKKLIMEYKPLRNGFSNLNFEEKTSLDNELNKQHVTWGPTTCYGYDEDEGSVFISIPSETKQKSPESTSIFDTSFDDPMVKAILARRLTFLVTTFLGVIAVMSEIPFIHPPLATGVKLNLLLYYFGYSIFFVTFLLMMFFQSIRQTFPINFAASLIIAFAVRFMTGMICSVHEAVILCLVLTTIICCSIIIFSMKTNYDLTELMHFVFTASTFVMIFGFVTVFGSVVFHFRWLFMLYACLAAYLFMIYLAIDIQMIMGGRKYCIDYDDRIFAAIQVFMDIIYVLWMVLYLVDGYPNLKV